MATRKSCVIDILKLESLRNALSIGTVVQLSNLAHRGLAIAHMNRTVRTVVIHPIIFEVVVNPLYDFLHIFVFDKQVHCGANARQTNSRFEFNSWAAC